MAVQPGLCRTWSEIPKTGFLTTRLIFAFQTIETDGASGATSFVIDGTQYMMVTNMGNHNRYETVSRLYRVNQGGDLTVVSFHDYFFFLMLVVCTQQNNKNLLL